jgi:FkbM family methyltransferase
MLAKLVPRGGTAIDVGANLGMYAYALAGIADWVAAFEPNPDYARFARRMLRGRAEVHEMALSDKAGRAAFTVPIADDGMALHLAGSLKPTHGQFRNRRTCEVEVGTLDAFGFTHVRFIKVDVEGSEREVLEGARATIGRSRPVLLLELLSGTYQDPAAETAAICASFDYDAYLVQRGATILALPAIKALGKNTSWGTEIETRNVLFLPR